MNINPTQNYLLVRLDKRSRITQGGIHIPGTVEPDNFVGVVEKAGPGFRTETGTFLETMYKVGDRVLLERNPFPAWDNGGDPEKGEHVMLVRDTNVVAIVKD